MGTEVQVPVPTSLYKVKVILQKHMAIIVVMCVSIVIHIWSYSDHCKHTHRHTHTVYLNNLLSTSHIHPHNMQCYESTSLPAQRSISVLQIKWLTEKCLF